MNRLLPYWLAVSILVAVNIGAAIVLPRIDIDNAPELYLPAKAPSVILHKSLREDFPTDEMLIGLFEGEALYGDRFLTALDRVVKRLEAHPLTNRVFSVTNTDHIAATEDGFSVGPLIDPGRLAETTDKERHLRALSDRFAPGLIVAKDGSAVALVVRPIPLQDSHQRRALYDALHDAVKDEGIASYLTAVAGPIALDVAELDSMLSDNALFVPITTAIGLLLLWWTVGRPAPVVIGAIAAATVVGAAVTILVMLDRPYTLVTSIVPPLLSAYTFAVLLHLYASLARAWQAVLPDAERVRRAVRDVHRPALYNVMSTGAGMLSLLLIPIPPIQLFGATGATGTVLIYLVVFHLVPPLLARWDSKEWPRHRSGFAWTGRIAFDVAAFSMRRAGWMIGGLAVASLVSAPLIARVEVESDLLKFFADDHPLTMSTKRIEDKLSGVTTLEVVATAERRDGLKSVAVLEKLKELQTWIESLPEVDRVVSMMDVVEEMHWAFNAEDPSARRLPASDALLSQLLLIYDGKDLHELVNREFQRTRLLLNLDVHGANATSRVMEQIRARFDQTPVPGVTFDLAGWGRLFADQEDLLVEGQIYSFLGAFGQILIILTVLWRSVGAAVLCLIPNVAPLYFIFVVMGATGTWLNMATVIIAGVVLGITVDDTIHLYHGYLHRRGLGVSPVVAMARSFEASGRAVISISVLLIAQFALLGASRYEPTADFGLLSATGLLAGQVFELVLLPALIALRYGVRQSGPVRARGQTR